MCSKKKYKRGYIISLAVVTILLILSILAIQILNYRYSQYSILRNQIFLDKTGFIVNDILMDVKKILSVNQASNSSIVTIFENYSYVKSSFLSNEQARLNEFSNITGMNISFIPPSPSSVLNISFDNGMIYITNETDANNKEIKIYNLSGTNLIVSSYKINIVSNITRGAYTEPTNAASGISVTINYTDPISAKSFISTRILDPYVLNTWRINLPTPSQNITVSFGLIDGKTNSLSVRQYNVNAITSIKSEVNITKQDVDGHYNIFLNVSAMNSFYSNYLKIR
ncbi:MAG: hypothetical protein QXW80_03600 [Candidatus Micrarchaeia archaeon]